CHRLSWRCLNVLCAVAKVSALLARHTQILPRIRRWGAAIGTRAGLESAGACRLRGALRRNIMLRHIAQAIALAFALAPAALADTGPSMTGRPVVEVVFVLDTTGSMGPLIEGAKRKIWSIATTIIDCAPDADIRMGLVAYRDIGDDYVTRR